jgi:hypothetical protein
MEPVADQWIDWQTDQGRSVRSKILAVVTTALGEEFIVLDYVIRPQYGASYLHMIAREGIE